MPSQNLFNRNLKLSIYVRDRSISQSEGLIFQFTQNNIQANLAKSVDTDVRATGTISVTNIKREQADILISPREAKPLVYVLQAGYGEDTDELFLVSEGYVYKTSFSHNGGEVRIDFSVGEAVPELNNPWGKVGIKGFPAGTTLKHILETFKSEGVEIEVDNNSPEIEQDLSDQKISEDMQIDGDVQKALNEIMDQYGYQMIPRNTAVTVSHKYISRRSTDKSDTRQLRNAYNPQAITKLNFNTGLLSASMETLYASNITYARHVLSFKSLFIPYITPLSFIELDEPSRYENLQGVYFVSQTSLSLNNFTGPFFISGAGIHLESEYAVKVFSSGRIRKPEFVNKAISQLRDRAPIGIRKP